MDAKELVELLKYNRERLIDERGADFSGVKALDAAIEMMEPIKKDCYWIEHKCNGMDYMECPNCSVWYMRMHLTRNSYCPNCGTKLLQPYCRGGYTAAGKSRK